MIKVHYNDDQDALFKACGGLMARFIDFDARVKSAASEVITRPLLEQFRPPKTHFAQHMTIMGDGEMWGWNRNGDNWSKLANTTRCHTFVTNGAYYREHNHRSRNLAIGEIKYAAHNPAMGRVELITWGDISKCEDIYESVKKGEYRSNSMSARVPFDVCSCCGKKSRSPADYCKHAAHRMNQWIEEFRKYAYVDNPEPTFFDASDVANPADRTAHAIEYLCHGDGELMKAASATHGIITGTQWAEVNGVCIPDERPPIFDPIKQATLQSLADEAKWFNDAYAEQQRLGGAIQSPKLAFACSIAPKMFDEDLSDSEIQTLRRVRQASLFGELAKRAAILPFRTFLAYATGKPIDEIRTCSSVKRAASILPQVFERLLGDGCGCSNVSGDMFNASSPGVISVDPGVNDPVNQLLSTAEEKFSIAPEPMKNRVIHITIIKSGSEVINYRDEPVNENLANMYAGIYGMYKVAALTEIKRYCPENISEVQTLLLAAHNNFAL